MDIETMIIVVELVIIGCRFRPFSETIRLTYERYSNEIDKVLCMEYGYCLLKNKHSSENFTGKFSNTWLMYANEYVLEEP